MVSTIEIDFLMVLKTRSPGFRSGRISSWWGLSCWLVDSCLLTVTFSRWKEFWSLIIPSSVPHSLGLIQNLITSQRPYLLVPSCLGVETPMLKHRSLGAGHIIQFVAVFCLVFGLVWFSFFACRAAGKILVHWPGNLCALQWKCRAITAGPPGKSVKYVVFEFLCRGVLHNPTGDVLRSFLCLNRSGIPKDFRTTGSHIIKSQGKLVKYFMTSGRPNILSYDHSKIQLIIDKD